MHVLGLFVTSTVPLPSVKTHCWIRTSQKDTFTTFKAFLLHLCSTKLHAALQYLERASTSRQDPSRWTNVVTATCSYLEPLVNMWRLCLSLLGYDGCSGLDAAPTLTNDGACGVPEAPGAQCGCDHGSNAPRVRSGDPITSPPRRSSRRRRGDAEDEPDGPEVRHYTGENCREHSPDAAVSQDPRRDTRSSLPPRCASSCHALVSTASCLPTAPIRRPLPRSSTSSPCRLNFRSWESTEGPLWLWLTRWVTVTQARRHLLLFRNDVCVSGSEITALL